MTPAKTGMQHELIEPLREFLQSFTQELTEQQFIPAFRDELRRLLTALDRIQESGDTLQQIATGVDRLREVFQPSGARMLEGVRELENLMRSNADGLKQQAEGVLSDLLKTHNELENALRQEANVLREQTSVGRETLTRTAAEIEERLNALTQQIDGLCRKTESEVAQLTELGQRVVENAAMPQSAPTASAGSGGMVATVELSEDLQKLFARTETVVAEELTRYQSEIRDTLQSNTKESNDRLARVDKTIEEALKSVGPKVQEELDSALERLRDQIQTLASVETEVRQNRSENDAEREQISDAALSSILTGTENRLMKELAEVRKSGNGQLTATQKAITDLALDLSEVTEKHTERLVSETLVIKDALVRVERILRDVTNGDEAVQKKIQEARTGVDALANTQQYQIKQVTEGFERTFGQLNAQSESLERISNDERQSLSQLKSSLTTVEDVVNRMSQTLLNDSRSQREKIESGLNELRQRVDSRLDADAGNYLQALEKLADDWTETLRALHGEIDAKFRTTSDALVLHVDELSHEIKDGNQRSESIQKDLVEELKHSGSLLGERLESLQENTAKFTGTMESHVKAVSGEVSKLTNKQDESLAVLKEAIRANYDDNAERMKQTILEAYDKFIDSIHSIPQALDRYSKLAESLHLNDRLALEGIQTETGNILRMQTEKFEELTSTTGGLTKIFPLMDKKFEKQGQILEAMRRSQINQDKEIDGLLELIAESRQETLNFAGDLKGELQQIESRTERKFKEQYEMIETTFEQLEKLQQTDLPAFGQELRNLLATKFEFIETTQTERENARRTELNNRLNQESEKNNKIFMLLGLIGALSVVTQIALNLDKLKGLLP